MNIVLMADSRKNELLVNFCIAYRQILNKHTLFAVSNTSRVIEEATGLSLNSFPTEISGTIGQLAARASYNEIDAVVYLRDPSLLTYDSPNQLLSACDTNSIPFATNIATAEILILAIDRGDLDWRELIR